MHRLRVPPFMGSFIQQTLNVGRVPGAMPAGQLGKAAPTARNPTMSHIAGFLDLGHHTFSPYFLHGYPILSPRLLCLSFFCGDHARQWCPWRPGWGLPRGGGPRIVSGLRCWELSSLCLQVFGRSQSLPGADSLLAKPIDKQHTDTVVNFLIRVACQVWYLCVSG